MVHQVEVGINISQIPLMKIITLNLMTRDILIAYNFNNVWEERGERFANVHHWARLKTRDWGTRWLVFIESEWSPHRVTSFRFLEHQLVL